MRGYWWSPDSASIAYQQTDTSGMERMHILDPVHPEREPRAWPYPRPGAAERVGAARRHPGRGRRHALDRVGPRAYPYLASVVWRAGRAAHPAGAEPPAGGRGRSSPPTRRAARRTELLREHDDAWINLDQSVPRWLANGQRFLWSSEREGSWQLELRGADGSLLRALTAEGFGYRGLLAVDEAHGDGVGARQRGADRGSHLARAARRRQRADPRDRGARRARRRRRPRGGALGGDAADAGGQTTTRSCDRREGEAAGTLGSEAEEPPFTPNLQLRDGRRAGIPRRSSSGRATSRRACATR